MAITSKTLSNIAQAIPVLDAEARKRAESARQIQIAQGVAGAQAVGAPGGPTARAAAQQIAGAATTAAAEGQITAQQRLLQNLQGAGTEILQTAKGEEAGQLGRASLAAETSQREAERTARTDVAGAERQQKVQLTKEEAAEAERLQRFGIETDARVSFMTRKQREGLAKLGQDVKQRLFDDRLRFERDEAGRKFSNERQLSDWAVATAGSQEALRDRMQQIEQATQRELVVMKAAAARLEQSIKQNFADSERELDQASKARIIQMKADLDREIEAKSARAAAIGNILSGAASGAMAGGAASGGNPWGFVIGGVLGAGGAAMANKQSSGSYV